MKKIIKFLLVFFILYFCLSYYTIYTDLLLLNNGKYTFGKLSKNTYGAGSSGSKFEYLINNIKYENFNYINTNFGGKRGIEGNNYLILYDEFKPENSFIFINCKITEKLKKTVDVSLESKELDKILYNNYKDSIKEYRNNIKNNWLIKIGLPIPGNGTD